MLVRRHEDTPSSGCRILPDYDDTAPLVLDIDNYHHIYETLEYRASDQKHHAQTRGISSHVSLASGANVVLPVFGLLAL